MSLCGRDECLGLFLSLLTAWQTKCLVQWCSYNKWLASVFPWQPPAYCSNPPLGLLICRLLIPSFCSFSFLCICLSLTDLSALAKKIKLEAMAGYNSGHQHGGPNGENGEGLGECCPHMYHMLVTCVTAVIENNVNLSWCAAPDFESGCGITSPACTFPLSD